MRFVVAIAALLFAYAAHAQSIDSIGGFPAPSGAAGGVLSGTYPNPGFAASPTFTGTTTVAVFTASNTVTLSPANHNVAISPTGTGTVTLGPPAGQLILANVSTGTNADFLCLSAGGVVLLQTSACTISSRRFKNNIYPVVETGLGMVMAMRPVSFQLKDGAKNADWNAAQPQIGLIAEDIAEIDPRLAIYEQDGVTPKSYRQESIIAVLVKAVQEQQREINSLRREMKSRGK